MGNQTSKLPSFQSSTPPRASLGFVPPLLGLIEAAALLLVALVIWRFYLHGVLASFLLVPVLLLSFIPYFIAVYVCGHPQAKTTVRAILFFSMVFRLIFLATPPELSDDVFRYIWEGRVQNHGHNPYALAPSAAELEPLRDAIYHDINHPDIPAIYPPFAQMVFRPLAAIPHPVGWAKFLFGAVDWLNVWLLILILRERKMPHQFALIYGWNPLPALEFAGSGHLLSAAICLFLVAYYFTLRKREIAALVCAGLAFSTHFLIVAPLLLAYNALQKRWLPVAGLVVAASYLPYLGAGTHLFDGLTHYGAAWRFNDSAFGLIARLVHDAERPWLDAGVHLSYQWPKLIVVTVLGVMALRFIFKETDWLRAGYLLTGTMLLLLPTVHPWYVTLILPFLCFYRNLGWLMFTALTTISYSAVVIARLTGDWPCVTLVPLHETLELVWIGWLEYAPFFALLLWNSVSRRQSLTEEVTG
jgi:hypothetical protein